LNLVLQGTGGREASMDTDITRKLVWSGLLAATGALASIAAAKLAAILYRRIYDEDPPE
jgi:hypothetical protein